MKLGIVTPQIWSKSFEELMECVKRRDLVLEVVLPPSKKLMECSLFDLVDRVTDFTDLKVVAMRVPEILFKDRWISDVFEKVLMAADELGCRYLVSKPPRKDGGNTVFSDELTDLLLNYKKTICWDNCFTEKRFLHSFDAAKRFIGRFVGVPFGLSYTFSRVNDVSVNEILEHSGYIKLIHVQNIDLSGRPIPIFRPEGVLNIYDLLANLVKGGYNGVIMLEYPRQYMNSYVDDLIRAKQYIIRILEKKP